MRKAGVPNYAASGSSETE